MVPERVIALLEAKSQQGKLPGFHRVDAATFRVGIFGAPYDRDLIGAVAPTPEGATIRFTSRLRRKMPWLVVIVTIISFWPGVVLTDSLLSTWFPSWYPKQFWITCAWYLPLCALTIPALWKQFKNSERASEEHLHETMAKLRQWLAPKPSP